MVGCQALRSHIFLVFAIFVVDLICTRQTGEVTTLNNNKLCKSNEGEKDAWNAAPSSPHGNHCPVLFFPLSRSLIYRLATCDFCCLGNCFPNPLSLSTCNLHYHHLLCLYLHAASSFLFSSLCILGEMRRQKTSPLIASSATTTTTTTSFALAS